MEENYQDTCFGHAFSKACQYVTMDEKVYKNLTCFYQNFTKRFAKVYNLVRKSRKGRQEVNKTCVQFGLASTKLNIPMKTR